MAHGYKIIVFAFLCNFANFVALMLCFKQSAAAVATASWLNRGGRENRRKKHRQRRGLFPIHEKGSVAQENVEIWWDPEAGWVTGVQIRFSRKKGAKNESRRRNLLV